MLKLDAPEVSGKKAAAMFISNPIWDISFLPRGGDIVLSQVFWVELPLQLFAITLAH